MRNEQESIQCLCVQYLGDISNWGLCRLMHHLFKIMYNTLGVNLVFLSRLTTINLIDLTILMKQQ